MFAMINSTFGIYLFFALIVMTLIKWKKFTGEWKLLVGGILLMLLGGAMAKFDLNLRMAIERFLDPNHLEYQAAKQVSSTLNVWSLVFTGGVFGLGVNLVASYLTTGTAEAA